MVKVFRLIQISDLHFSKRETQLDDEGKFLDRFKEPASINILRKARFRIRPVLSKYPTNMLIFQGDVEEKGYKPGMRKGCDYLANLWNYLGLNIDDIIVNIGNHDVCRFENQKFDYIKECWKSLGYNLFLDGLKMKKFEINSMVLFSLNSCHGCGEVKNYSKEIRELFDEKITDYKNEDIKIPPNLEDPIFNFLDIPIIDTKEIDELQNQSERFDLLLVQAHHNILPQIEPRTFGPEIVTGGYFRRCLLGLNRPVIYLHGHIHNFLSEILIDPENPDGILIIIGTPDFPRGFNLIEIYFTEDEKPIACKIRNFTLNEGYFDYKETQSYSLCLIPHAKRRKLINKIGRKIIDYFLNSESYLRFKKIIDGCGLSDCEISKIVEEINKLDLLEFIEILNKEEQYDSWIIKWREQYD